MKYIMILLIRLYQRLLSPLLKQVLGTPAFCRYSPTCSEYAVEVTRQYGILYGSYLALKRLLTCQPFYKHS